MNPPDNNNEDISEAKKLLEDSQLKKLALEIKALERIEEEETNTKLPKQKKLDLELKTLLWQTGRVYRLSQFAIIASILATLVTIFATSYGIWASYQKDTENKTKELRERTDSLYRAEIQRLIQYPIDPKITISEAIFLFRDLEDVVENGYEKGPKQDRQKDEIGTLMSQMMMSPDVDTSITRNVEFDRKALANSVSYRNYLIRNPKYNRDILSKYKASLATLHAADPGYSIVPDESTDEMFSENNTAVKSDKNQEKFFQYIYIFYAYRSHVDLLKETAATLPEKAQESELYLGISFCWFYGATANSGLTSKIYGGTDEMIGWRWQQCK
jgi:hypothetical protein